MLKRLWATVPLGPVVLALLAGCTVGPLDRPPVLAVDDTATTSPPPPSEAAPLPPLGEQGTESLRWSDCDKETTSGLGAAAEGRRSPRYLCASVFTELSVHEGTVELAMLKAQTGGEGKLPLVVVSDIEDEPGTLYAARLAASLPDKLLDRFDIIGFDRRGTGRSDGLTCMPRSERHEMLSVDPAGGTVDEMFEVARSAVKECTLDLGNDQRSYDARGSATDLETIRAVLGMPRLHVIAHGEGARVVAGFVERFPGHVGRVVLDGVPDQAPQTEDVLEGVAAGAEATLTAFAEACAARDCPLGDAPGKAVTALIDGLRDSPRYTSGDIRVGPSFALYAIWAGLARPQRWDELAAAIARARDGDVDRLAAFALPLVRESRAGPPMLDGRLAHICNDTRDRLTPDQMSELAAQWAREHPTFGGLVAQRLVWCSHWPVPKDPPSLRLPGAPPVLVVSTKADPLTPLDGTTRSADQMRGSTRIAWQGAGHGAVGRTPCVDSKITAFLVDGKSPRSNITCPA